MAVYKRIACLKVQPSDNDNRITVVAFWLNPAFWYRRIKFWYLKKPQGHHEIGPVFRPIFRGVMDGIKTPNEIRNRRESVL